MAEADVEWGEAMERIGGMPAFLDAALTEATPEEWALAPGPGEFSLVEHACHLRDLEREGYLVRVRSILSAPDSVLEPFDGAAIARSRDYGGQDAQQAARDFASARRELVSLLAGASAQDRRRTARFGGRTITLAGLVAMIEEHDREHREAIERLLEDLED